MAEWFRVGMVQNATYPEIYKPLLWKPLVSMTQKNNESQKGKTSMGIGTNGRRLYLFLFLGPDPES